ncbi:hypothetical protein [Streptomyces griseoruber]|uniref:hypothetical protein n=1 Tax=Streptomyces griseoruber TaxID=1943 RepID=UPI0037B3FDDA
MKLPHAAASAPGSAPALHRGTIVPALAGSTADVTVALSAGGAAASGTACRSTSASCCPARTRPTRCWAMTNSCQSASASFNSVQQTVGLLAQRLHPLPGNVLLGLQQPITDGISSPLHDGDDTTHHPCRTITEFIPGLRKSTDHARKNDSQ